MNTFDAHAHMVAQEFRADRAEVLQRSERQVLLGIISVVETLEEARENLSLARQFSILKPAAGLFPTILALEQATAMISFIREKRDQIVAIGEVGPDHWEGQAPVDRQAQK